jgi:hypothetical protein
VQISALYLFFFIFFWGLAFLGLIYIVLKVLLTAECHTGTISVAAHLADLQNNII